MFRVFRTATRAWRGRVPLGPWLAVLLLVAGAAAGWTPPAGAAGGTLPTGPAADAPSFPPGARPSAEALLAVLQRHEEWFVAHRRQIRRGANDFNFQTALRFEGRAYLKGVDLSGAKLWEAARRLAGREPAAPPDAPRAQKTDGRWPRLGWADLSGANLRGASLPGADLMHTIFADADLRDANLARAFLDKADLRGADLRGADLRGAYLLGARLDHAKLAGARLEGAFLARASLTGVDLTGVDLSGADFGGRRPGAAPAPQQKK